MKTPTPKIAMMGLTIYLKQTGHPGRHVLVNSLQQARDAVTSFIGHAGIGASEWEGGRLMLDGERIGSISYNGRAWGLSGHTEMMPTDKVLGAYAL